MLFTHLQTPRLRLRPLALADKAPLLEFFADPVAMQFLLRQTTPETTADAWLAKQLHRYESGSGGLLAVERLDTGELVGQCGLLWQFVEGIPKWEVGYHFIRRFWGNGFATEAAAACRDFAFENDLAETVISLIHPENWRSQAVARRNGMAEWKQAIWKNQPLVVFRIGRSAWEEIRSK